jgi:hypothetical protein
MAFVSNTDIDVIALRDGLKVALALSDALAYQQGRNNVLPENNERGLAEMNAGSR